jgi:hypothetical protein
MGIDRAALASAEGAGPAANSSASRCGGGPALHFADVVSVASAAARLSKPLDGAALLLRMAGGRAVVKGQFFAGPNCSRAGWPRSQPFRRRH